MKIIAVIQARMGSSRCPGKVLCEAAGRPLLQYIVDRLGRCSQLDGFVIATSDQAGDDPIEDFCRTMGAPIHRGSLGNVASRFDAVVDTWRCDAFVRVNGDSPLLDQALIDRAAGRFREGGVDMVSNVFPRRSFPRGQSVEVLDGAVFRQAFLRMENPEDLEHVTRYFHRNAAGYRVGWFGTESDRSAASMAVDTPADLAAFTAAVASMDRPHWTYGWPEALDLLEATAGRGAGEAI